MQYILLINSAASALITGAFAHSSMLTNWLRYRSGTVCSVAAEVTDEYTPVKRGVFPFSAQIYAAASARSAPALSPPTTKPFFGSIPKLPTWFPTYRPVSVGFVLLTWRRGRRREIRNEESWRIPIPTHRKHHTRVSETEIQAPACTPR